MHSLDSFIQHLDREDQRLHRENLNYLLNGCKIRLFNKMYVSDLT